MRPGSWTPSKEENFLPPPAEEQRKDKFERKVLKRDKYFAINTRGGGGTRRRRVLGRSEIRGDAATCPKKHTAG